MVERETACLTRPPPALVPWGFVTEGCPDNLICLDAPNGAALVVNLERMAEWIAEGWLLCGAFAPGVPTP